MNNCPTCGRKVANYFEHVDTNCGMWPDDGEAVPHMYRSFVINYTLFQAVGMEYAWSHESYDGPEDNRAGVEGSVEACYRAIDEWYEDNDE